MKIFLLSFTFLVSAFVASAQQPNVCVLTNLGSSGTACTALELGPVGPCSSIPFIVKDYLPVPSGYAIVGKFEWFVNGVSVKTTTDPSDYGLNWVVVSNPTNVYCKVTYKKSDGTLSTAYTSTTFSPFIKQLNFGDITTSTQSPNYGCTTNTVSYSLNTYTCTSLCSTTYTVGQYNITWQPPSGWIQTSISANGNDVSFTPDATSAGLLTATIHLPCGYTETKTFNISRVAQAPIFTTSGFTACTSSTVVSINSTCGASSYTYTIVGNSGITFTSNGQQTLTSTSTTINLSIAGGGSSVNTLKAKANYPNNISSAEASATLIVGLPYIGGSYFTNGLEQPLHIWFGNPSTDYNNVCNLEYVSTNMQIIAATSVTWSKITSNPGVVSWGQNGNNLNFYLWDLGQTALFKIEATNGCGTSSYDFGFKSIQCGGSGGCDQFSVSPNPATNSINIIVPDIPAPCDAVSSGTSKTTTQRTITEIKIYDQAGNLKKIQKENKTRQSTVNLIGFKTGLYVLEITDGNYKERHQIIIQQ
jgi:hypothetical protein